MPWIWYANRALGRHLVMPGDCCSHLLGIASRIPLKWQHLFFSKDSERCFSCNGCHNTALVGRRKVIWRSFSLYKGGKTSLAFIFHKGLHDFRAASHERLKRKWGETVPVATVYSVFKLPRKDMQLTWSESSCTSLFRLGGKWGAKTKSVTCRGAITAEECRERWPTSG